MDFLWGTAYKEYWMWSSLTGIWNHYHLGFQELPKLVQIMTHTENKSVHTLVKKGKKWLLAGPPRAEQINILFTINGNLWTEGSNLWTSEWKMWTSSKITFIPWNALQILELRSQKLRWSFTCQHSRKRLSLSGTNPPAVKPRSHSEKTVPVSQRVKLARQGHTDLPGRPRPEPRGRTGRPQPHGQPSRAGALPVMAAGAASLLFKKELFPKFLFPKLEKPCF